MGFLKSKNKEKKNSRDKQKKRTLFGKKTTKIEYVENEGPEASSYLSYANVSIPVPNHEGNSSPRVPTASLMNSKSFDQKIIATEKAVQKQIRKLESKQKDLSLQSDTGVLLFEGMKTQNLDEQSAQEIDEYGNPTSDRFETGFVNAPKYDPVKSGFYEKKKKYYYDSDDEDDTVPSASPKEKTSTHDGSIWDLMGGLLLQPSNPEVIAQKPSRDYRPDPNARRNS